MEEACPSAGLLSIESQHMASHIQVHTSTTGIGTIDRINYKINTVGVGVVYMPGLVLISTHISKAYFLG